MTDLQKRYEELKKQNLPDSERIKFIVDLGGSEEIEYHYQLICTDRDEGTNLNLSGSFYKHDKKGLEFLFEVLEITDNSLRRKVIIALGWIGSSNEIDILTKQMLEDKDSLCRAWSASSLMQMSFHGVEKELLQEKTKSYFASTITAETNLYACGIMIESAQILFGKKWISSSTVEYVDTEKIEKERKSAVRFLKR